MVMAPNRALVRTRRHPAYLLKQCFGAPHNSTLGGIADVVHEASK